MISQPISKKKWIRTFYEDALRQYLRDDVFANKYNSANWVFGKEVRIYKMPGVSEDAVKQVALGVSDLVSDLSLDFRIDYFDTSRKVANAVMQSARGCRIDPEQLSNILVIERFSDVGKRNEHAVVVVLPQYLCGGDADWGESRFTRGNMFLALPGERQKSLDFIRKVAKHEAGHLFGYMTHHDAVHVVGYDDDVDCNMLWRASTSNICDKCKDAMLYFWKGVEHNSGERFFKE